MAGLVAGARARELGATPVVLEKGNRPGGSMLLSSGVVWRHRSVEEFRAECPGGDPALQRRIVDELDEALDWLESLGVEPVARETGNPLTVGRRYDTRGLTDTLARAAGDVRLGEPFRVAQILATGGFGARLARERGLLLRANEWSEGDGLDYGVARGGSLTGGMDEFYGRALPGGVDEREFVSAAQLYARHALALDEEGRDLGEAAWHESDLVQRLPGGRAWYVVDARALRERVRERTVADLVEAARAAGGDVRPAEELPFALPASPKLAEPPFLAVRVHAAVTHTIGGLRIDEQARVLDADGRPLPDLFAAGADAGGIFTGGYGSGLAAALVFGRIAAESALSS
jgi:fumarate reductase flavoprotein subunit